MFPVQDQGKARIMCHLLHVRFKFVECSIYIEEERRSKAGELVESIPIEKSVEDDGHCWYLTLGNYRAFGLPLAILAACTEIVSR